MAVLEDMPCVASMLSNSIWNNQMDFFLKVVNKILKQNRHFKMVKYLNKAM